MITSAETALFRGATDIASAGSEHEVGECTLAVAREALAVDHGGVILLDHRGRRDLEVGSVDDLAVRALQQQTELGDGPQLDLRADSPLVWSADVMRDPRWPHWGSAIGRQGLRGLLSVQLRVPDRVFGSLSLFTEEPRDFTVAEREFVGTLGALAGIAVSRLRIEAGLNHALEGRTVIGQAVGILMERLGLDEERAFDVLRRNSHQNHLKLRDVAAHTVTHRELPGRNRT